MRKNQNISYPLSQLKLFVTLKKIIKLVHFVFRNLKFPVLCMRGKKKELIIPGHSAFSLSRNF